MNDNKNPFWIRLRNFAILVCAVYACLLLFDFTYVKLTGQTPQQTLTVVTYSNITSATRLDGCDATYPCIDNRSQFNKQSSQSSYRAIASGVGSWSVDMQYADNSSAGPWTSFGSTAQVTQASTSGIGYGIGPSSIQKPYHDFIRFVMSGNVIIQNYSGTRQFWWLPSVAALAFPITATQGGTVGAFVVDQLYATPALGCSAANSNGITLVLTTLWAAVPTQSLNCNISALTGGVLRPASGQTITIQGSFEGDNSQHFDISSGGVVSFTGTVKSFLVTWWGVIADGTGSAGTSQTLKIQAALTAATGNTLIFPKATNAYVVGNAVYVPTLTRVQVDGGATVQKLFGTQPVPPTPGACSTKACSSIFVAGTTTGTAPVSGIWFTGAGTIDGNKANITGITGDGFNEAIYFGGCSNCGITGSGGRFNIINAYTDAVYIDCWYDSAPTTGPHNGSNVLVDNVILSGSGRVNYSPGCGINNVLNNFTISGGGARVPVAGVDFEVFESGQLMTGGRIENGTISNDGGTCITLKPKYDINPLFTIANVICSGNSGGGLGVSIEIDNQYSGGPTGTINVSNLITTDSVSLASLFIRSWDSANFVGVNVSGAGRGVYADTLSTLITFTSGVISGITYDIDTDCGTGIKWKNSGVRFAHNTNQTGTLACQVFDIPGVYGDPTGSVIMPVNLSTAKSNVLGPQASGPYALGFNPVTVEGITLNPIPNAYRITIPLTSALRASGDGANTLQIGSTAYEIRSHRNPANLISTAYVAGGSIDLFFSGYASSAPTTLSAAITTTSQTVISVTSGAGISNAKIIQIDCEWMTVVSGGGTGTLTVTRATPGGCIAATHTNGTTVSLITLVWEDMSQ